MLKLMIFGRRAPGTTRRGAQDHLRMVHGKMVVCPPGDAGAMPGRYVQNHVIDGLYMAGGGAQGIERDLVTELWFNDFDDLRGSTATPYYLDNLKPDEPRFVDDSSVEKLLVRTETLLSGENGLFKVFAGAAAPNPAVDELFIAAAGIGGAVRNAVMSPPGGAAPFVAVIYEAWFDRLDDAFALAHGLASLPAGDARPVFALVAEQYDAARLKALF